MVQVLAIDAADHPPPGPASPTAPGFGGTPTAPQRRSPPAPQERDAGGTNRPTF